jgi:predicted restriction endonuclease
LKPKDAYGYINWLLNQSGLDEMAVETLEEIVWELEMDSSATTQVNSGSNTSNSSKNSRGIRKGRYQSIIDRRYRDETIVRELKELYRNTCQVCGTRRQKGATAEYSEVHHIKPLGLPHEGPDRQANLLVLCPNHHSDFDYGTIEVDPDSFELHHLYEDTISKSTLQVHADHNINLEMR